MKKPPVSKGSNAGTAQNTAVAYVRVSSQEQVLEGVSLAAQRERAAAYCVAAGLDLVEVISDEGVSGSKPLLERTGGKQLVKILARGQARHVVALKLDRLFRDVVDALSQTASWDKAGVGLHMVDLGGNAINTTTAAGRMFLTMLAGFAELERNLVGERTAVALAHKKRGGKVYGPTPYGFDRLGDKLVANKVEAAMVRRIQKLRSQGASYLKIAERLNAEGVTGKRGGRWHAAGVRYVLGNDLHQPKNKEGHTLVA